MGIGEKVGYFDIETTGLNANWDYIISYALKIDDKTYGRSLTKEEVLDYNVLDRKLIQEFNEVIKGLDRLVVYWGKDRRHDVPFIRTRALRWGIDFPLYKDILVTDCYDIVKGKLRLHRNRLENVCDFLGIPSKEHRLDAAIWQKAKLGDKRSLKYIWDHNREDVVSLKGVYERVKDFSANTKTSI
jgi:uncharacterized protein YprB with RNaseH-like and TPR domain